MKKKKGQVAMEYIMILSLVLMILIPTIYIFREYVTKSAEDITVNKVNSIARNLIDTAREMYYLGAPSKVVIDLEMPAQIEAMWLMENSDANAKITEYLLVFKLNLQEGEQLFFFDSDIPLKCNECKTNTALNSQCETSTTGFKCHEFPEIYYSTGIKHFKIEADTCSGKGLCVLLNEISTI